MSLSTCKERERERGEAAKARGGVKRKKRKQTDILPHRVFGSGEQGSASGATHLDGPSVSMLE
jgi:hypothetical protein